MVLFKFHILLMLKMLKKICRLFWNGAGCGRKLLSDTVPMDKTKQETEGKGKIADFMWVYKGEHFLLHMWHSC